MSTGLGLTAGLALSEFNHARDLRAIHDVKRSDQAQALFAEWLERQPQAIAAETLLTRHLRSSRQGQRRQRAYELRMSGGGGDDETALFAIMTFFQKAGGLMCAGRVNAGELSSYLGDAPRRWRDLLRSLRERSQPSLDGTRWEQLDRAIFGAEILAGPDDELVVGGPGWQPAFLTDEMILAGNGESWLEGRVVNRNGRTSPVPALCVVYRGVQDGHYLVFPSHAVIPAVGSIELRGRLPWRDGVRPSGVRIASELSDFGIAVDGQPFPGPHGSMSEY
ncbi:MAG: hypothetical protein AB7G40_02445 [Hyphomonadaceae bacterium]